MLLAQPATVCAPLSAAPAGGSLAVKLGASLTAVTVSPNTVLWLPLAAFTVRVILAVPLALAGRVMARARVAPLPLRPRLAFGTRLWLSEVAVIEVKPTLA